MKDLTKTMEITMRDMDLDDNEPGPDGKTPMQKAEEAAEHRAEATAAAGTQGPPPTFDTPGTTTPTSPIRTPGYTEHSASHSPARAPGVSVAEETTGTASSIPAGREEPRRASPYVQAIMDKSDEDHRAQVLMEDADGKKKGKAGLTKEQREELARYEKERREIREKRVNTLVSNLVDKISIWTETDKSAGVTRSFEEKIKVKI